RRRSLERANVNGGAVDSEGGEKSFHNDRSASDNEAADNRELSRVRVTAPDGEAPAHDANSSEDEADEHDNAQCLARATCEVAGSLRKNRNEVRCEKFGFHVRVVLPRAMRCLRKSSAQNRRKRAFMFE